MTEELIEDAFKQLQEQYDKTVDTLCMEFMNQENISLDIFLQNFKFFREVKTQETFYFYKQQKFFSIKLETVPNENNIRWRVRRYF
jgi:hypothetical protein